MLRNNLRLLIIGYSDTDADLLSSELANVNSEFSYECIRDVLDIRSALYASDLDAIISNHDLTSFNYKDALDALKISGRDIPFIVYSDNADEKEALSAIHSGAHDFVHKGNTIRLALSIERELKNVSMRRAKVQAETQSYRSAYFDPLTNLPKRNLFCEQVTEILSKKTDANSIAAVYFITFDRLPYINSTYGFSSGDALIQQLSYRLSVYASRSCLLTRVEGGKFAFFNDDVTDSEDIQHFASRIMRLTSTPFIINNLEFYIKLNVGICVYPVDGESASNLLANAENTLPGTRALFRTNYKYYIKDVGEDSSKRIKLETSLRNAIINNELLLHYQPIVDVQEGNITGVEALVRWNHPEFGLLMPDKFLPLAHETGFIVDIGKWVLREACINAKLWQESGHDSLSVAVNISAIELDQTRLINHVSEYLTEADLSPDLLTLEVTESVLVQDAETSIRMLQGLKELGVKIIVDKFGEGYSSISNLKRLPIDGIKIEHSFIRDIVKDPDNLGIIQAIIALSRSLDLPVMAAGIETKEQFDFLCEEQCTSAQGYLFSKPVNNENLSLLLGHRKTGTMA
ncbi:MAG: EAL domain-containing protein [Nitrosomonas sp.]|nr:EAL domain-containing protein [Nitrosomonas sp.]